MTTHPVAQRKAGMGRAMRADHGDVKGTSIGILLCRPYGGASVTCKANDKEQEATMPDGVNHLCRKLIEGRIGRRDFLTDDRRRMRLRPPPLLAWLSSRSLWYQLRS